MDGDQSTRRGNIPTPSSSTNSLHTLPSGSITIPINPPAQAVLTDDRHTSRRQFQSHPHPQPSAYPEPIPPMQIYTAYHHPHQNTLNNTLHAAWHSTPVSPTTPMTTQTTCSKHLLLSDLRPLSNQEREYHSSNRDSCETLEPSGSCPFPLKGSDTQQHSSTFFEDASSMPSREPRALCRHPSKLRGSRYTRFFGLERPTTQSRVVVQSPWLSTGPLFVFRSMLFVYAFAVLATDLFQTERPRYSFCYLTQLSYLGLVSYLGVSFFCFDLFNG